MQLPEDHERLVELGLREDEAAFDDGLIGELSLTPRRLLEVGERLAQEVRPWAVRVVGTGAEVDWGRVFSSPLLAEARSLEFDRCRVSFAGVASPPKLERLRLGHGCSFDVDELLGWWPALRKLTHLDVSGSIDGEDAGVLLRSGRLEGLVSLGLNGVRLGEDIVDAALPSLRHLDVGNTMVQQFGLARASWLPQLRSLVLDDATLWWTAEVLEAAGAIERLGIHPRQLGVFEKHAAGTRLTSLKLAPTPTSVQSVRALLTLPTYAAVDDVDLDLYLPDPQPQECLALIAQLLPRLRRLRLRRAPLGDGEVKKLLHKNRAPAVLELDSCVFDIGALRDLAVVDGLDAVQSLSFAGSNLIDRPLAPLAQSAGLPSLTRLDLVSTHAGLAWLAAAPWAKALRWLFLGPLGRQLAVMETVRAALPGVVIVTDAACGLVYARERRLTWRTSEAGW